MPRAVLYAEAHRGEWAPVPDHVHLTSIEARGWEVTGISSPIPAPIPDTDLYVFALVFDDGSTWDPLQGFVEAFDIPPWALEGMTPAEWLREHELHLRLAALAAPEELVADDGPPIRRGLGDPIPEGVVFIDACSVSDETTPLDWLCEPEQKRRLQVREAFGLPLVWSHDTGLVLHDPETDALAIKGWDLL